MTPPLPPAHRSQPIRRVSADGGARRDRWGIATETAIEINVNGRPLAVMMATPQDIEDLARGFALTEGVISSVDHAAAVAVRALPEGVIADLSIAESAVQESRVKARFLEGRSGCGLCGVETLADAIRPVERPASRGETPPIAHAAIRRAFGLLGAAQPLNQATRSVHGAAWCAPDGAILAIREDVGRHNALDKLIGACSKEMRTEPGFVVMTSRCSFELVQKTAISGAVTLATVSAPTSLAIDLARAAGVRLVCRQGDDLVEFDTSDEQ